MVSSRLPSRLRLNFKILALAILVLIVIETCVTASFSSPDERSVWVKIYRIQKIDEVEGPFEGEADWAYEISVSYGEDVRSWRDKAPPDNDDIVVDRNYRFDISGLTHTTIFIHLWEEDGAVAEDADISSHEDDYVFTCTYNFLFHDLDVVQSDTFVRDGDYCETSGDYDGSTDIDENDANLWFKIWDTPIGDKVPPQIAISSPENKTYNTDSIALTFTVNEPTSWMGYSLDDTATVTITGDGTLTGLPDGSHHITVYARDTSGNMGSAIVYFTVSTPAHDVAVTNVTSYATQVHEGDSINITVAVKNKGDFTETFNATICVDTSVIQTQTVRDLPPNTETILTFTWNTTCYPPGNYSIRAEASNVPGETNTADNAKVDGMVNIIRKVDNVPPEIVILSPKNRTYALNSVLLTVTINEPTSWIAYSVDGEVNITIAGETKIKDLNEGSHYVTVFAADISGNVGSAVVHFTISAPPEVELLSPENKTYTTSSVPLTFAVNEPTSWIGCSLDGEANVTITGNTTLTGLSSGVHYVRVYAEDPSGNIGSSGTVYFFVSMPLLFHDVAVTSVGSSATEAYEGDPVNITIGVQNNGNYTETFNVTIYVDNVVIQTQTVFNLVPAAQNTLIFIWNTTGFSLGNYAIKAEADIVPGETQTADNIKINSTVHVTPKPPSSTLPLFIIAIPLAVAATLFAVIIYKRKRSV